MNLRPLVIDDEARARVAKVVAYAEQKEHWYVLAADGKPKGMVPGDNYRHVTHLDTYRCVFSWTFDERTQMLWRHLTISIPSIRFANPIAAYTIADLFGFTGWSIEMGERPGHDWLMTVNPAEHCVVLQQAIEPIP